MPLSLCIPHSLITSPSTSLHFYIFIFLILFVFNVGRAGGPTGAEPQEVGRHLQPDDAATTGWFHGCPVEWLLDNITQGE